MPLFRKNKKICYQQKNFENPFFKRKRRFFRLNFSNYFKGKIIFILLIGILAILIWFLFFSNFFRITEISVNGFTRINSEEIRELAVSQTHQAKFIFASQENIMLFDKNELQERIDEKYALARLVIKKKYFHKITIDAQEKPLAFIWLENQRYYYSDMDGYVIKEVSPLDIKDNVYPIIENNSNQAKLEMNKINVDQNLIAYVIELDEIFKSRTDYGINVEKFFLGDDPKTVKLKIIGGPQLFFNLEEGSEIQIEKMLTLKSEKLKDDFFKKEYIDLRFGDRVYYR